MAEIKELKVEDIRKSAEENSCPVQKALYYITEFISGPLCGKCFPCSMGSYEARLRLQALADGRGTGADVRALKRIAAEMAEASMCKKGKDTAAFITAWTSAGAFDEHAGGNCAAGECLPFIEYRVDPDKCTMCGVCKDACKYGAILGEKAKPFMGGYLSFEIRQKRCTKCSECIKVCPEKAIITVVARVPEAA